MPNKLLKSVFVRFILRVVKRADKECDDSHAEPSIRERVVQMTMASYGTGRLYRAEQKPFVVSYTWPNSVDKVRPVAASAMQL